VEPYAVPTFEFDDGAFQLAADNTDASLGLSEDGVSFTWSVSSPSSDGANLIWHFPNAFGGLDGHLLGDAKGGASDVFALNVLSGTNANFAGSSGAPVAVQLANVVSGVQVKFIGASSTQVKTLTGAAGTLTAAGQFSEIQFTTSGKFSIDAITTDINCFLSGTLLSAADGAMRVEDIQAGDRLMRADGRTTCVKWVAKQEMHPWCQTPEKINPVCIKAGALAEGVPARNLFLTLDHGVVLDGLLINAGALCNGTSIFQVERMPLDGFCYYHVETDAHDVIVAEGAPVESFADFAGRADFDNAGDHPSPDAPIREMPLPRVTTSRMVPPSLRRRLEERARAVSLPIAS
jgi:hypothetical protein